MTDYQLVSFAHIGLIINIHLIIVCSLLLFRVLVLDQGKVVEFDSPEALLQKRTSIFYSMAKDAGLVS